MYAPVERRSSVVACSLQAKRLSVPRRRINVCRQTSAPRLRPCTLEARVLEIAYYEYGAHVGFPVCPRPRLPVRHPRLRGHDLAPSCRMRGVMAPRASDIGPLLDALGIQQATLVGYAGYDVAGVEVRRELAPAGLECVMWYQHLSQSEKGRKCLARDRRVFDRAAESFENPDFVDAVVHAYRFVHGKEAGDPALDDRERKLAGKPKIAVPCIMLDGTSDPLKPGASVSHAEMFAGRHEPRAPEAFAQAIIDMRSWSAAAGAVE
ncbi:Alpha/Beta hydrolase protein [Ustulina deusta]|nr:Alpha/Beta hydrolase protein [Ustulina deusta]